MATWFSAPSALDWDAPADGGGARDFHRSLPGYAVTPLVELPSLAAELGVARVLVKDESSRLGLPAFKILGASWACRQVLLRQPGLHRHVVPLRVVDEGDEEQAGVEAAEGVGAVGDVVAAP